MGQAAEVLRNVLFIPREFLALGTLSMVELLERSGYVRVANKPSAEEISAAIATHPDCVDDWLLHSSNQRSSGWYFAKYPLGYEVGLLLGAEKKFVSFHSDATEACALYVKEELQTLENIVRGIPAFHREHVEGSF